MHEEFLENFLEHQRDLRAFIGSLVREPAAREDVFQEVALILWREWERFDRTKSFGAWARGIAANKILHRQRADRRFPVAFEPETMERILEAFDSVEHDFQVQALRHCMDELPAPSRELLELRYQDDLRCEAIAEQTERSVDAVYQTLSRLRRLLRDCVKRTIAEA